MDREEILKLAGAAHDRREYFNMLGVQNTKTDYEGRKKQTVEYELARAEMREADRALRNAQD